MTLALTLGLTLTLALTLALGLASSVGSGLDEAGWSSEDEESGVIEGDRSVGAGAKVIEISGLSEIDGESLKSGTSIFEGMAVSLISASGVRLTTGSLKGVPERMGGDSRGGKEITPNELSADDMGVGVRVKSILDDGINDVSGVLVANVCVLAGRDSKIDGVTVNKSWEPKIALGEGLNETSDGRMLGMLDGDAVTEADGELGGERTGTILGVLVGSAGEEGDGVGQLDPESSTNSIPTPSSFARSALMEQDTQTFTGVSAILAHLSNLGQFEDEVHTLNSNIVLGVHKQTISSSVQGDSSIEGKEPSNTLHLSDDEQSLSSRHESNDRP